MKLTLPNQLDQLIQVKPNNEIYHIQLAIAKKKKKQKNGELSTKIFYQKRCIKNKKKEEKFEEQYHRLAASRMCTCSKLLVFMLF